MTQRLFSRGVWPMAALAAALLFTGCGGDDGGVTEPPVVQQLAQGWERFSAGEYAEALDKFEEAVASEPGLGDGDNGLGWTYFRLDSLADALAHFDRAVAKGFVGADAQAGRCLLLNRADEYGQSVFAGEAVLAIDSAFVLEADRTVDVRDVRLAMAQCHLALGAYEESLAQIMFIDSSILINPNSATFVVELVAAIEELTANLTVY